MMACLNDTGCDRYPQHIHDKRLMQFFVCQLLEQDIIQNLPEHQRKTCVGQTDARRNM